MLKERQDAIGRAMLDYMDTGERPWLIHEVIERDDGYVDTTGGPTAYFAEYRRWPLIERKALKYARGRILDVGCGAGRHSLYFQSKGHEVVGIDNSPAVVEVCKKRGHKDAHVIPLNKINSGLGTFDTILMMGNNFGLFGSGEGARRLLRRMSRITSRKARIIVSSNDVYNTDNPEHLRYHETNRQKGRMSGQMRLRVRYHQYATPWFDYLLVSQSEMVEILEGTDWQVKRFFD
jgi:SAM-dependent methyltransferase